MAISPTVTDISALAASANVVGFTDQSGHTKLFASKASGAYKILSGTTLPTVASVAPVTAPDGSGQVGAYKVTLAPAADDAVNTSSPMFYVLDPGAQVLTNSTAS